MLFVITSTPSIEAELLESKLLAVSNVIAVDFSNFYDSRSGGTANNLRHKKDCVGYLVKATANVTPQIH